MFTSVIAIKNDNDKDKAAQIYNLYYGTMLYVAKGILGEHHLAEDAISESFIKIINNLDKIHVINCNQTRGFIVIIVRNTALDMLRKQRRDKTVNIDDYYGLSDGKNPVLDSITTEEACSKIASSIAKLNKNYADVLYLKYKFNYSNEEIGNILGITTVNAKVRLSRARKTLKEQLQKERI